MRRSLAVLVLALAGVALVVGSARAEFAVDGFDGRVVNQDGSPATGAGAHPWAASTDIEFNTESEIHGVPTPVGSAKDISVDLPPGFVGNLTAVPQCPEGTFSRRKCADATQVGLVQIVYANTNGPTRSVWLPVYNLVPGPGQTALFGLMFPAVNIHAVAVVRPDDYGVTLKVLDNTQTLALISSSVELWGVPADPSHDAVRGYAGSCNDGGVAPCPAHLAPKAFLTNPTACTPAGTGLETRLRVNTWQNPDVFAESSFVSHLPPGYPLAPSAWGAPQGPTDCEALSFDPSFSAQPTDREPDAPTGLDVQLRFPQTGLEAPAGRASAYLEDATVTLPEGMTINPGAADGLQACSDAQLKLRTDDPLDCPEASKIGIVRASSPLLAEQLAGGIYIRSQNSRDPRSGEMFRIALAVENKERGIVVRLPGQIRVDPATGRIVASFANNPQLPVSTVDLSFKSGPRAALATPRTCGEKTITAEMSSWSGQTAVRRSTFTVPCTSDLGSFAPTFSAGTVTPVAGTFSPFVLRIDKADRQSDLRGVALSMPEGLLANLRGNVGAQIGVVRVAAGPGVNPFRLSGPVVLEGPYGDAPFSLRVTVPAVAGPFDLGEVVVRQRIYVDPVDARVTVVSDPLPTIVGGVPPRLQSLQVDVNRPGFVLNPTSCAEKAIGATLVSATGQQAPVSARFQVGDCASLAFRPRLAMRLSGRRQTRTGGHPGLKAVLTQGRGQANVDMAKVTLPRSVVLDARNAYDPKLVCDYDRALKADCPASSVIGRASADTPVLNRRLSGNVHLVQGIKFGKAGNRIRTLPTLLVKLRARSRSICAPGPRPATAGW